MMEPIISKITAPAFSKEFIETIQNNEEYLNLKKQHILFLKRSMEVADFPDEILKLRSWIIPLLKRECEMVEKRLEAELSRSKEYAGNVKVILDGIRNFRVNNEPILVQEVLAFNPFFPDADAGEVEKTSRELWWSSLFVFCLLTFILVWPISLETGNLNKDSCNDGEILRLFGIACHNAGVFVGGSWSIDAAFKERAKRGADKLHDQPGGSRDKKQAIREIWASGKYDTRTRCAEEECAALDMSYDTARKALRNAPKRA